MVGSAVAARKNAKSQIEAPLSGRLAEALVRSRKIAVPNAAREKLKICLLDFFACAFEAHVLPWARQAAALATAGGGPCRIIGTGLSVPAGDAVFANSVAGHGLVREDMHTGSVSHLGIVVLPPLLALAELRKIDGATFIAAAIAGYELGGRMGRALVTPEFTRTFRPTGFTGPLASAAASAHLLDLDEAATGSALSLAANMVAGQNQWPHTGADEMFFEAGLAARNGLTAAQLASLGAYGSERALDGEAGLLPAYRPDHRAPDVRLFDGELEIMSVFFKPVPVCNFAQTPCLAALALAKKEQFNPSEIAAVHVKASRAAKAYPGCDYAGPFSRVLQAKMSIHYAVASALLRSKVDEASYVNLDDPAVLSLARKIHVEADPGYTAAFPGKQGAEVEIKLQSGKSFSNRLPDVVPATVELVRQRPSAKRKPNCSRARSMRSKPIAMSGRS
jgi:2-methylcitrate dehydratase PrpD